MWLSADLAPQAMKLFVVAFLRNSTFVFFQKQLQESMYGLKNCYSQKLLQHSASEKKYLGIIGIPQLRSTTTCFTKPILC